MSKHKHKYKSVIVNVLPGERTDGSGRVCIHLFVRDPNGPFVEPHVLHRIIGKDRQETREICAKPTRGRLACDPKRKVAPVYKNGITIITLRTDDPRAVSCPKCKASPDYISLMKT
jgi:hypothetical protein